MSKLGTSVLRDLIRQLPTCNLSESKKQTIQALVDAELSKRNNDSITQLDNAVRECTRLMEAVRTETFYLRQSTSPDGDLVSLQLVQEILTSMKPESEVSLLESARANVIRQALKEINKLPRFKGDNNIGHLGTS